jgi:hypothetical protein
VVVTTVLCTLDGGCKMHPKNVEGYCRKIKYRLLVVASRWTFIIYFSLKRTLWLQFVAEINTKENLVVLTIIIHLF